MGRCTACRFGYGPFDDPPPPPTCLWLPAASRFDPISAWLFSRPYVVAMLLACVEHGMETVFVPFLKRDAISWLGLAMLIAGQTIRTSAVVRKEQRRSQSHGDAPGWDACCSFPGRCLFCWVIGPGVAWRDVRGDLAADPRSTSRQPSHD